MSCEPANAAASCGARVRVARAGWRAALAVVVAVVAAARCREENGGCTRGRATSARETVCDVHRRHHAPTGGRGHMPHCLDTATRSRTSNEKPKSLWLLVTSVLSLRLAPLLLGARDWAPAWLAAGGRGPRAAVGHVPRSPRRLQNPQPGAAEPARSGTERRPPLRRASGAGAVGGGGGERAPPSMADQGETTAYCKRESRRSTKIVSCTPCTWAWR